MLLNFGCGALISGVLIMNLMDSYGGVVFYVFSKLVVILCFFRDMVVICRELTKCSMDSSFPPAIWSAR